MKIKHKDIVGLYMDRKTAKKVLELLNQHYPESSVLKEPRKELKQLLAPSYEYEIKCRDCARTYTIESKKKLTDEEVSRGGICVVCSDDYK